MEIKRSVPTAKRIFSPLHRRAVCCVLNHCDVGVRVRNNLLTLDFSMVWRKLKADGNECQFCNNNVSVFKAKNNHNIQFHNSPSAIRSISNNQNVSIPTPFGFFKIIKEVRTHFFLSINCYILQNMLAVKGKDQRIFVKKDCITSYEIGTFAMHLLCF